MDQYVEQLGNKLMQAFNKGLEYLDIVLVVDNGVVKIDVSSLIQAIRQYLGNEVEKLIGNEEKIMPDLEAFAANSFEFYEQEKLRNQIRLRFAIERFLSASYEKHGKFFLVGFWF